MKRWAPEIVFLLVCIGWILLAQHTRVLSALGVGFIGAGATVSIVTRRKTT